MLNFDDILSKYPQRLRGFKENILKEYLQHRILDIIYSSKYADRLIFMGGTAIRVVHQGGRFSEDLDFDNQGVNQSDFNDIAHIVERELSLDGYTVETKNVLKGAYHCYIRFPQILFDQGLSGHKQQRILIQIDAEPQNYYYTADKFLLNRFGLFRYINTVPAPVLLAQKIYACLNRKRPQGRDFFDVVFLASITAVDYQYLKEKTGISTKTELAARLTEHLKDLDLRVLARDVEPFLIDPTQKDRVELFAHWLKDWK